MHAKSRQSCPTLCDPMDCSLPSFFVHGILQAKTLEWIAISCSRGSFWPRDWTWIFEFSCIGRWVPYHYWVAKRKKLFISTSIYYIFINYPLIILNFYSWCTDFINKTKIKIFKQNFDLFCFIQIQNKREVISELTN